MQALPKRADLAAFIRVALKTPFAAKMITPHIVLKVDLFVQAVRDRKLEGVGHPLQAIVKHSDFGEAIVWPRRWQQRRQASIPGG